MNDRPPAPEVWIRYRFKPGAVPWLLRLRRLLKTSLWYDAVCVDLFEVKPDGVQRPAPPPPVPPGNDAAATQGTLF
jgi:hypothetical protein